MAQRLPIQVGTVVVATRRPGYSFIFRSGRYDGFKPREVAMMLHVTDTVCPAVAGYQFRNVTRLARDFEAGYFAPAFPMVSAPAPPGPRPL